MTTIANESSSNNVLCAILNGTPGDKCEDSLEKEGGQHLERLEPTHQENRIDDTPVPAMSGFT